MESWQSPLVLAEGSVQIIVMEQGILGNIRIRQSYVNKIISEKNRNSLNLFRIVDILLL